MRALTVLQCTTPFKRQHSASPVCHKACTGSLPRATMQPWPRLSPDVKSGGRRPGALCRCFPVWLNICLICWHPTCSALTPPSLPLPFSDSLSHNYWVDSPVLLSVSNLYICTQSQTVLCRRECGYSRPRGPRANPPIHCCSLHYQLYLSICPSVHHCLYPAAHLAFLLASLPHTLQHCCTALGYLQRPSSFAHKHKNSCSLQYVCSLPPLLLSPSLSKSKVLHLLMIEAISSHLYYTGIYIQTKDNAGFAALPLSSCLYLIV